jgi:hypothetical protein
MTSSVKLKVCKDCVLCTSCGSEKAGTYLKGKKIKHIPIRRKGLNF